MDRWFDPRQRLTSFLLSRSVMITTRCVRYYAANGCSSAVYFSAFYPTRDSRMKPRCESVPWSKCPSCAMPRFLRLEHHHGAPHALWLLLVGFFLLHATEANQSNSTNLVLNDLSKRLDHEEIFDDSEPDGDYLPENPAAFVDSDSTEPVFLQEPQDDYVSKNRNVELLCLAAHAHKIYFRCTGEWDSSSQKFFDFVDPMTGIRQMEAKLTLRRSDVPLSGRLCHCVAWSTRGQISSRKANITVA
ncbi:unnamed protein product [Cyprideis torosa]|uniref:Netrin receptor UNC5A-D-like N-terminal domain-containing protein n=1 Tax=Cyprideis torosa TaxID=163714 RepID=A0A7R8ZPC3_9CRUS|nr:unnamed protein product [Cyprideis torosa]CAG0893642.1 unnamed protein product [Cyprideis torosa]